MRQRAGSLAFTGRLHDPADAEVFLSGRTTWRSRSRPDDARTLKRRRMDGLKDLVHDAGRPGGLAGAARADQAEASEDAQTPSRAERDRRAYRTGGRATPRS